MDYSGEGKDLLFLSFEIVGTASYNTLLGANCLFFLLKVPRKTSELPLWCQLPAPYTTNGVGLGRFGLLLGLCKRPQLMPFIGVDS